MYHEVTPEMKRKRKLKFIAGLVVLALMVGLVIFGVEVVEESTRQQGATSIRDTVLASALQCCAIEGAYPQSLQYLIDNYGLTVNQDDYIITYEAFASNVVPSVVVVPR